MEAPRPSEARITSGYTELGQRTQKPRPVLLGWLDQYGQAITGISVEPAQGNMPAEVVILRRVPGHESDPLAAGMRRLQIPVAQIPPARDWLNANSGDPFGVPYGERVDHAIVGPALQRIESVVEESAVQA